MIGDIGNKLECGHRFYFHFGYRNAYFGCSRLSCPDPSLSILTLPHSSLIDQPHPSLSTHYVSRSNFTQRYAQGRRHTKGSRQMFTLQTVREESGSNIARRNSCGRHIFVQGENTNIVCHFTDPCFCYFYVLNLDPPAEEVVLDRHFFYTITPRPTFSKAFTSPSTVPFNVSQFTTTRKKLP